MKTILLAFLLMLFITPSVFSQNIRNTLGPGGSFVIKDSARTFLSLDQGTGEVTLRNSLSLPYTSNPTLGVIYKGPDRFMHNYQAEGTDGINTFIGINAGNFTMAGLGSQASYNTAVGCYALFALTTGRHNSAFGYLSLSFNTTGDNNSAFGNLSLQRNTTGFSNSAFGDSSLTFNTSGINNAAFGKSSLNLNTIGTDNCAFGSHSLSFNKDGLYNSAFGSGSLYLCISGRHNSAFGYSALRAELSGTDNSAFGAYAMQSQQQAVGNSAFGFSTLFSNSTGSGNSAFGQYAGYAVTTGSNLTLLGSSANPSSPSTNDEITLGNFRVTQLRCNVTSISSLSDARDKRNIQELPLGIDFLMKIRPRLFHWDRREWYDTGVADGSKMQQTPTAGFVAQELDSAQTGEDAVWLNLVLKANPDRLEATPGNLLPIIVKAIQDLKIENDKLRTEKAEQIARLENEYRVIVEENARLRDGVAALASFVAAQGHREDLGMLPKTLETAETTPVPQNKH